MSWAISVLAVVGLAALVALVRKHVAREREARRLRWEGILEAAGRLGFHGTAEGAYPDGMPTWAIVPKPKRVRQVVDASRGDERIVVFDIENSGRTEMGYNTEITGSDESRAERSRHTVVCLRRDGRSLPRFELLPNLGRMTEEFVDVAMQQAAAEMGAKGRSGPDSAGLGVGLIRGLAQTVVAMRERPGSLPCGRRADFEQAMKIYGDDPGAIDRVLTDEIIDRLLATPGLIVAADGQWLLFSRNVRLAGGDRDTDLAHGLLTIDEAGDLMQTGLALAESFEEGA